GFSGIGESEVLTRLKEVAPRARSWKPGMALAAVLVAGLALPLGVSAEDTREASVRLEALEAEAGALGRAVAELSAMVPGVEGRSGPAGTGERLIVAQSS